MLHYRRLSPQESAASEQSMLHNAPDNDFVNTLIRAFMSPGPAPADSNSPPVPLQLPGWATEASSAGQLSPAEAATGFPAPAPELQAETSAAVAPRADYHAATSAAARQQEASFTYTTAGRGASQGDDVFGEGVPSSPIPESSPGEARRELDPGAALASKADAHQQEMPHHQSSDVQQAAADVVQQEGSPHQLEQKPDSRPQHAAAGEAAHANQAGASDLHSGLGSAAGGLQSSAEAQQQPKSPDHGESELEKRQSSLTGHAETQTEDVSRSGSPLRHHLKVQCLLYLLGPAAQAFLYVYMHAHTIKHAVLALKAPPRFISTPAACIRIHACIPHCNCSQSAQAACLVCTEAWLRLLRPSLAAKELSRHAGLRYLLSHPSIATL